jgi:hypothetical protein
VGIGWLSAFEERQGSGEGVVDGQAAAHGQLRRLLAAEQKRSSTSDGQLFCLRGPRPGPQPEMVTDGTSLDRLSAHDSPLRP